MEEAEAMKWITAALLGLVSYWVLPWALSTEQETSSLDSASPKVEETNWAFFESQDRKSEVVQGIFEAVAPAKETPVIAAALPRTSTQPIANVKMEPIVQTHQIAEWKLSGTVRGKLASLEKGNASKEWRIGENWQGCVLSQVQTAMIQIQCGEQKLTKVVE